MSIYYNKLDWPVLSAEMHKELIALAYTAENVRPSAIMPTTARHDDFYHHYVLPSHIEQWCRSNLPIDDTDICRLQRFPNAKHIPKHTDAGRIGANLYLLSSAGPETQWYSKNQLAESVVLPQHQWVWINTGEVHEVINISDTEQDRIAISIFKLVLRKDIKQKITRLQMSSSVK